MSAVLNPSFRRLGDWAGGTVVVHDPSFKRYKRLRRRRGEKLPDARPVAPPLVLDREESGALMAFAQRRAQWNQDRAQELSDILSPVTGLSGGEGLERVMGYGTWLGDEA